MKQQNKKNAQFVNKNAKLHLLKFTFWKKYIYKRKPNASKYFKKWTSWHLLYFIYFFHFNSILLAFFAVKHSSFVWMYPVDRKLHEKWVNVFHREPLRGRRKKQPHCSYGSDTKEVFCFVLSLPSNILLVCNGWAY